MRLIKLTRRQSLVALGSFPAVALPGFTVAEVSWTGKIRLLQGPMLGAVSEREASIWLRADQERKVEIEYWQLPAGRRLRSAASLTTAGNDFTAVVRLEGLEPGTNYLYQVLLDGRPDPYLQDAGPFRLRSAPAAGRGIRFSVAFGSCAKFQDDPIQPIWHAIERASPDLFFWLGDNIYADTLEERVITETYRYQRSVPSLQPVLRNIPQLAVWDDHDSGLNDHDRRNPVKDIALRAFQHYWANPAYGLENTHGVFFEFRYGGIDFFFLDVRYYRDPNDAPDGPDKTMLGKAQLSWLKTRLQASRAPFRILVSGSGWSRAKGPTGDAWSAFLHERDELFNFIRDEKIHGVVLLSGDTHVGELNCIPWSEQGGYDLYDLVSSPLAQPPERGSWLSRRPEIRIRQVHYNSNNFGLLEFDLSGDQPRLIYTLRDVRGYPVWQPLELAADELVAGRQSWTDKIDPLSLERYRRLQRREPYYAG